MDVGPSCTYPTPAKNCLSQTAFFVQWLVAMYSVSIIDNAMVGCFLYFHKMTPTPTTNTYPMVDCGSFASPVQSTSQKTLKTTYLHLSHNLKSKVPFKYLMVRYTAIQCGGPAFDMNWLTILTANAISTLVATIAYMRDPIPALYETPSIS